MRGDATTQLNARRAGAFWSTAGARSRVAMLAAVLPAAPLSMPQPGVSIAASRDCGCRCPPTCFASAKTTVPARSTEGLCHFSCCGPRVVPHGPCAGATRSAALTLRVPRIRTSGAPSYGAGMRARLTQETEKPSNAPDTSANRAHRLPAASAPVMDRLERDPALRFVGPRTCSRDVRPVVSSGSSSGHNTHEDENSRGVV